MTDQKRAHKRLSLFIAVALIATSVLVATSGGGADAATAGGCAAQDRGSDPVSGLVKQAHPVVLVHGWDGAPLRKTRSMLEDELHAGWQFRLFDYSSVHDHWAARPEIAACLASYLARMSQAHRDAGGDGKVYLVAHSMGGLAVSYAVNPAYGKIAGLGDHIGGLVTIDTPWTGSPWGSSNYAKLVQGLFNRQQLPGPDSDAWLCLRKTGPNGTGGCSTPAYLPRNVPVAQLAGELTVRRTFFNLHAYDISLGSDTVVESDSQHGYVGSAAGSKLGLHTTIPTVPCTTTMNALLAEGGARLGRAAGTAGTIMGGLTGTELQLVADGRAMDAIGTGRASAALIEFLLRALVASPCSHTRMTENPDAISAVAEALRAQAAPPALIRTDLLNAPVPAYCQHAAGRLVDGELPVTKPNGGPDPGFATVLSGSGKKKFLIQPVLADLTRDGVSELSGVLLCSAGGVTWPELILVYSTGLKLMGYVGLGDVTSTEHSDVKSMSVVNGDLRVTWLSYEGCCFDQATHTGRMHWDGTHFVMKVLS